MNNKDKIRKIIINEVAKLLDEDYESIQEIKLFANDILRLFAKENFKEIVRKEGLLHKANLVALTIEGVYQKSDNKQKYVKLKDFVTNANVVVYVMKKGNDNIKGHYSLILSKEYNHTNYRDITIFYSENLEKNLQEKIKEYKDNNRELTPTDIYVTMYYELVSTAIHELQHAYDDYRSKGKSFNTKEFKAYMEKYAEKEEFADKKEEVIAAKEYLKLPHEVWARFSQAMDKTRFTSGDFVKDESGKYFMKLEMKSLKSVVNSFFYNFENWGTLLAPGDKLSRIQKRLINAVVQFWHKEQERIVEENKNPQYFN